MLRAFIVSLSFIFWSVSRCHLDGWALGHEPQTNRHLTSVHKWDGSDGLCKNASSDPAWDAGLRFPEADSATGASDPLNSKALPGGERFCSKSSERNRINRPAVITGIQHCPHSYSSCFGRERIRCSAVRCRPSARRRFRAPVRAWRALCPAARLPGRSCSRSSRSPGTSPYSQNAPATRQGIPA